MRITDNMRVANALAGQARTAERLNTASQVAATGLRVNKPSDDPAAYASMVDRKARLQILDSRSETTTRVAGDLELAEGVLSSSTEVLVRAKEIAVQAANGSIDPQTRSDMAKEVRNLRESLVGFANTRGASGYLFGGTNTATQPFDTAGNFFGNDGVTQVEIANGVTAGANTSGARAFTAVGGRDVLADLANFANALSTNDVPGIQAAMGQLDGGHRQLIAAQVNAGLGAERLRSAADVIAGTVLKAKEALASEVEGDPVLVYSDLSNAKSAYERSIAVTREILSLDSFSRA